MSKPEIVFEADTVQAIFPDGVRGVIESEEGDLYYHSEDAYYSADELRAIADQMDSMGSDSDGWISWNGGECPVPNGTRVDVRFRDGKIRYNQQAWGKGFFPDIEMWSKASIAFWRHDGVGNDIIAYRVVED